jgi:hypothetical protein
MTDQPDEDAVDRADDAAGESQVRYADEPVVDEPHAEEPAVDEPAVDEPAVDEARVDDAVADEPPAAGPGPGARPTVATGHPAVDEVLRSLDGLDGRPVDEHVAAFEQAHEVLRRALSDAGDDTVSREG